MSRFNTLSTTKASASASSSFTTDKDHHQKTQQQQIPAVTRYHPLQHPKVCAALLQLHAHANPHRLPLLDHNFQPIKAKRVTDPLNEAVRARLCGKCTDAQSMATATPYSTSGSDHDIDSLTGMFHWFREEEEEKSGNCSRPKFGQECGSDAESAEAKEEPISFLGEQLCEILEGVSSCCTKVELMLLRHVTKALAMAKEKTDVFIEKRGHEKNYVRRFVMNSLRCAGYNAGICKSRWEQTNGFPAGEYEFIDVIVEGSKTDRLFVDIDFKAQFEIARPTAQYNSLVQLLPTLFVGRADKLRQMIKIMCDAARRSLKAKGMHLPPWRKNRYVQAKWLGPYRRTINPVASTSSLRQYAGIAALKGVGMGMVWDAGFIHQMELHFEKAVREANKSAQEKLKCFLQPQASNDLRFEGNSTTVSDKLKSPVIVAKRDPVKISGLATAMAEPAHTHTDNVQ